MLPPNQLDVLPNADALRARGIVYAYRQASGVLVTFRRLPGAVQRDMLAACRRSAAEALPVVGCAPIS